MVAISSVLALALGGLGIQAFRAAGSGADAARALADATRGEGIVRRITDTVENGVGRVTQLLIPPQAALMRGMISDEKWGEMTIVMERVVQNIEDGEMPLDTDMELVMEFIELLIPSLNVPHVPGSPFDVITDDVPANYTAALKELHKVLKEATAHSKNKEQDIHLNEVEAVFRNWKEAPELRVRQQRQRIREQLAAARAESFARQGARELAELEAAFAREDEADAAEAASPAPAEGRAAAEDASSTSASRASTPPPADLFADDERAHLSRPARPNSAPAAALAAAEDASSTSASRTSTPPPADLFADDERAHLSRSARPTSAPAAASEGDAAATAAASRAPSPAPSDVGSEDEFFDPLEFIFVDLEDLIGAVANSPISLRDIVELSSDDCFGLEVKGLTKDEIKELMEYAQHARIEQLRNKTAGLTEGLEALRQTSSCYRRLLKQASPVFTELVGVFSLLARKTAFTDDEYKQIVRAQKLARNLLAGTPHHLGVELREASVQELVQEPGDIEPGELVVLLAPEGPAAAEAELVAEEDGAASDAASEAREVEDDVASVTSGSEASEASEGSRAASSVRLDVLADEAASGAAAEIGEAPAAGEETQMDLPRGVVVREADLEEFRAALEALSTCTFNQKNPLRLFQPWSTRESESFSRHLGALERVRSLNEGRIAGAVRQMTYGLLDPVNAAIDDVERRAENVKTIVVDIPSALVEGLTHPGFVAGMCAVAFMISGVASAVLGLGAFTIVSHFACAGAISLGLYAYKHGMLDTHLRPVATRAMSVGLGAMRSVNAAWEGIQARVS